MHILFSKKFKKKYVKLPQSVQKSFDSRLVVFVHNQYDQILKNHELQGEWEGFRSISITGDYRAIFEEVGDTVTFIAIGTHAELYE